METEKIKQSKPTFSVVGYLSDVIDEEKEFITLIVDQRQNTEDMKELTEKEIDKLLKYEGKECYFRPWKCFIKTNLKICKNDLKLIEQICNANQKSPDSRIKCAFEINFGTTLYEDKIYKHYWLTPDGIRVIDSRFTKELSKNSNEWELIPKTTNRKYLNI